VYAAVMRLAAILATLAACAAPAAAPDAVPEPRLRLATWNLEWLGAPPEGDRPMRGDLDYARLARYAETIGADVVALQEVASEEAAARVFDPARWRVHLTGDAGNPQRTGFAWRRGLPVEVLPDVVELALGRHGLRRGADVAVDTPAGRLRLLSVHLKSGCWDDAPGRSRGSCETLERQWPELERWIDARAAEGSAFAVLGDFNRRLSGHDRLWKAIDDADPPGADLTAAGDGRRPACWGGRYPAFVDHLVFGAAAARLVVPGSFREHVYLEADARHAHKLSDHCPLSADLRPEAR
jgi:endonuclease/exonuclease/phosphatase family metal-dependent hydrolase